MSVLPDILPRSAQEQENVSRRGVLPGDKAVLFRPV